MDAFDVETNQLRDKVAHLSGLLVTTMTVVNQLRNTTVSPSAFGRIGVDVASLSRQVQDHSGTAIAQFSAVFQELNRLAVDFAHGTDRITKNGGDQLDAVHRMPKGR